MPDGPGGPGGPGGPIVPNKVNFKKLEINSKNGWIKEIFNLNVQLNRFVIYSWQIYKINDNAVKLIMHALIMQIISISTITITKTTSNIYIKRIFLISFVSFMLKYNLYDENVVVQEETTEKSYYLKIFLCYEIRRWKIKVLESRISIINNT